MPTDSESNLPSLIDACCRGDRQAWDELVGRYSRLVWSIPRKYGLSESDCEDVHQTVFSMLVRHITELRQRDRLASWLITTATRECWRLRRAQRVRSVGSGTLESGRGTDGAKDSATEFLAEAADDRPHQDEERQLVRDGLARLGAKCRDLLTALFSSPSEPRYPEIAERLGMPVGSIGPNRGRCLEKLEVILKGLGVGASSD